ncbi:MAG TPA: TonB-dependent receptor [Steroidobacteraceae bacterium]|jgi:outer membrane receptor protein involved in Fe transport
MQATLSKPFNRRISWHVLFLRTLIAGSGACLATLAYANDATTTEPAATGGLEEIVVTATRREESISKVPISITALSQDALDQKGIRDFTEMVRFTPGVSIDTSGTNAISIRGISSSGGAGTTGIYIDDTPIQMRAVGFNPDDTLPKTFDLDRVEVLRGPQGTLFGAGSEGGTVRYIMTQPSVSKESSYARTEVAYTQYGEPSYEAGVAHGGPIIDGVLGFRASAWYRFDGGWINRVDPTTGQETEKNANRANTVALRLAMLYEPVDSVKITPSFMYQNKRQHDLGTYWPAYSNPSAGRFNNATPERIPIPDEYYLPALKIQIDFAHMSLISNTSYYHRNETDAYQGTGYDLAYFQSQSWLGVNASATPACGPASTTAVPPCSWYPLLDANGIHLPAGFAGYSTPNTITNQQRTVTQEFRLQSNDDSSAWKWTVGAFWSLSRELSIEQLYDSQIVPFWTALYGSSPFDYSLFQDANGNANYYCNGVGTPGTGLPNCDIYYNKNTSHDRQLAGFGEATYSFTDQWKLTAGGRFADMKFDLSHYANGLENSGLGTFSGAYHQNAFTPKLSVSFQADPKNLFYATYAKGFRPGGVNAPLPSGPCGITPTSFQSDTTQSYEIGSKNNFDNRFRLAASVYYIKWNSIQQNVYDPGPTGGCGFQYTANLGTAVAKGFDLQGDAELGGGLTIEASVGYTSARYSKSSSSATAGDAISGEAAINYSPGTTPPWTVAVGPQYNFSLAEHEAFVRVDWEYTSRNPWLAAVQDPNNVVQYNQYSFTLPSTSFTSARAGMKLGDWQVSAFVDNIFDSHALLNYALVQNDYNNPAGPPPPQQNAFTFRPRTFGITATFRN